MKSFFSNYTHKSTSAHACAHVLVLEWKILTRTDLSILIKARAALGLSPVHGLLPSAICHPITHPEHTARVRQAKDPDIYQRT